MERGITLVLLMVASFAGTLSTTARGDLFTVNASNDVDDGVCDAMHCSLREAIDAANANVGTDTIAFDIPGSGPHTIQPTSVLPTVTDPVIFDGYTQPGASPNTNGPGLGSNATLMIELDGSLAGMGVNGLTITGGNSTVRGLVIKRFASIDAGSPLSRKGIGILLQQNGGNVVEGNYLGTDVSGTMNHGNEGAGVFIDNVPDNIIGGTTPQTRNVISGNGGFFPPSSGVWISGPVATGNLVHGNFIGVDSTGTVGLGNSGSGVAIFAPDNTIGGTTPGARNVISRNGKGVSIGAVGSTGNLVQGNFIGTDVTGTLAVGNLGHGIHTFSGGDETTIGGDVPGAGNVISGNLGNGVLMIGSDNTLQGNLIGTDMTGTADLGNGGDGVEATFGPYLIGGTTPDARNVISGNQGHGLDLSGLNNLVQGNFIGTDATGTAALGNGGAGIKTNAVALTIGGTAAGAGNVISSNSSHGIQIDCCGGIVVQGNFIGTGATGIMNLGNSGDGVRILSTSNHTIGGMSLGAGNIIAYNGGNGVSVTSGTFTPIGNAVLSNSIFSNAGLGIDLGADGVTPNDVGDSDTGPNNLGNTPVLTAVATGSTIIEGTLNSIPNAMFTIDFFSSTACDPSGHGEGETVLGSTNLTTDGSGNANFTVTLPDTVPAGHFVTATATDPGNNTSEFSPCQIVEGPPVPPCPWDLNGDGVVNVLDLIELLFNFGPCGDPGDCPADFNGDGIVNVLDLLALLLNLGACPGFDGCPWDVDGDGVVGPSDLHSLIQNLGPCQDPGNCPWDFNADGIVDGSDLLALVFNFGPCP